MSLRLVSCNSCIWICRIIASVMLIYEVTHTTDQDTFGLKIVRVTNISVVN